MASVTRIAAADVVTPAATAGSTVQTQQHLLYEGTTDGWRVWSGRVADSTTDGVQLTGNSVGRGRQLSIAGDISSTESFNTITGDDGSTLKMYLVGPVNRATGALNLTGTVTEATGAWAHLLGQPVTRVGTQFHPAGPFVPGQSYFDGVLTIGGGAAMTAPKSTTDLGRDLLDAPRRVQTARVASASLELVPPRIRLS